MGTSVPYTVQVTPTAEAAGRQVTMQVRLPNGSWAGRAVVTLDGSGAYTATVKGSSPGVSTLRAVLPRSGSSPAVASNTCRIRWVSR